MDAVLLNTQENINNTEMKKPLEVWHLFVGIAGVLVACWGIVYMANKDNIAAAQKVENHEVRITQLERQGQVTDSKLDKLDEKSTQILIILNDKENKK